MSGPHLTRCEWEVMEVVWSRGSATVQDVVDALRRPLAYTTVMTTLNILDDKRYVVRTGKRGRAYVYAPTVGRDEVRRSMLGELQETLFGGSAKSLVLSLIEGDAMSSSDIAELKRAIRALERDA